MADPAKCYDVSCSSCPRTFTITLQILSQKRTCAFCGEPLRLSAEILSAIEELKTAKSAKPLQPVSVECPVCYRAALIRPESFGRQTKCSYCTCPFIVAADGTVTVAGQSNADADTERFVTDMSCPQCRQKKLKAVQNAKTETKCDACGHTLDLSSLPLESFVDLSRPGEALMTDFAYMALRSRWSRRDLGLAEATAILGHVNLLDAWVSKTERSISPFSPETTADIVQYAIACSSSAMLNTVEEGLMLVFPQKGESDSPEAMISNTALASAGMVMLGATGSRMHAGFGAKRKKDEKAGEPATCLVFSQIDAGTDISILARDPAGNYINPPPSAVSYIDSSIRNAMPNAARQYLAFKAVFGNWATGAMLYGITANAIQRRLTSLGGTLSDKAGEISAAIVPKAALTIR
jgi:hypothetical protein